ncbi:nuclear transport factor 2 family protein [Zhongshania aquimaris]|uniref:Nuclear transport factor 2 family protein n=1 Tax=Zhongshania aquimaris TaxID=2857107 RepID=A0ABS6VV34_9GAMM|nr:nuclear transport factor 2 family protein [Zhongshania aquimaris]MBW2942187.1 nuclear transport factor 2 family protein [Zhongshania aquimaris]
MAANKSLEERIQCIEDMEDIKKLKARWWFACDVRDTDGMRNCYNESDFEIDFGFIGTYTNMDEFIGVFEDLACNPSHIDMHHGMAPDITITGPNTAEGRWRMRFQLLETEKKMIQMMHGYYDDKYIKLDSGEWKMSRTKYTIQSNLLMQVSDDNKVELLQMGANPGLITE